MLYIREVYDSYIEIKTEDASENMNFGKVKI